MKKGVPCTTPDLHVSELLERLCAGLYLVAAVFILTPVADILVDVLPISLDSPHWRFNAAGVASGHLLPIIFGFALAGVVAVATGTRFTVRMIGVLAVLTALMLLGGSAAFVRDAVYVDAIEAGTWKTGFKLCSATLALGVMGGTLLRLERAMARAEDDGVAFLVRAA